MTPDNYATIIDSRISQGSGFAVRPLSLTVSRLIATTDDPCITAKEIERVVECDPALAVSVLHFANASAHALATEVKSIDHAVSLMGVRKLRNLAISIAAAGMFKDGDTSMRERHQLWMHSLGCATVARLLAEYVPNVESDDAFLVGVLHDIGKLLLYDVASDRYKELLLSSQAASIIAQEEFWFGTNHAEIGLRSAISWKLPSEIQVGIGYHHSPQSATSHFELAALVHIANQLAKNWNIGSEGLVVADNVGTPSDRIIIDDDILRNVRDRADEAFHDTVEIMM